MLGWSAQTTLIAIVLAAIAWLASRSVRLGPAARHVLWLVVLIKLLTPPVLNWPWSPPELFSSPTPSVAAPATPAPIEHSLVDRPEPSAPDDRVAAVDIKNVPTQPTEAIPAPEAGWNFDKLGQGLFALWLGISATIAVWQIGRIVRFHHRLARAIPAPEWLVQEVRDLSAHLGVRSLEILVLPDLAPPMLWFLGRTKLLVPGRLVSNADPVGADRLGLRAILAHELAHLRRGDHWVRRLDFFASLIWWWNPVYWLTRERLSAEAELACDEWAIRAVPEGRVSYAEALLDVCRTLSTTRSPAPALGVAGAGRFLERRVKMILQDHAPSRISVPVLLGAGLLFLLALPGWSAAGSPPSDQSSASKDNKNLVSNATIDDAKIIVIKDDDDDKDEKDDKDDAATKAEIAKELKKELGPGSEFQKEMKHLGEELKKELGPGSEFQRQMKKLGPELQKELGPGSEFEMEMKNLGEDLQKDLGPGSDFQKHILLRAKEIEKRFGPGSDFERRMQHLGKKMAEKYGEDSEFAKKIKKVHENDQADNEQMKEARQQMRAARDQMREAQKKMRAANEQMKRAEKDAHDAKSSSEKSAEKDAKIKEKAAKKSNASKLKARDLKALRAQIDELNAQLKRLEAADRDENE